MSTILYDPKIQFKGTGAASCYLVSNKSVIQLTGFTGVFEGSVVATNALTPNYRPRACEVRAIAGSCNYKSVLFKFTFSTTGDISVMMMNETEDLHDKNKTVPKFFVYFD